MKPIDIIINFNRRCCRVPAISSIFAGLKVLEENGIVRIRKYNMSSDFAPQSIYPHRYVIELNADNKKLVYDISDGYQDFDFAEKFDSQLESIDYFFKSSYDPEFAKKLKNKDKFKGLGISYGCSYPGSFFEKAGIKNAILEKSYKEALYIFLKMSKIQAENDFRTFEGNNHFESYNILHWTRLWEYGHLSTKHIMKAYPALSEMQAKQKANEQIYMLKSTNSERIKTIRLLKDNFGDRFIGGLSDNPESRKTAPDLITTDPRVATRKGYLDSLKQNYIHILSKGIHGCIGARYGETFAAGRALVTDPFVYEPVGNLQEGKNYLKYSTPDEIVSCIDKLLKDINIIHEMENRNYEYYNSFVRPDIRMLNTFKIAFPERF